MKSWILLFSALCISAVINAPAFSQTAPADSGTPAPKARVMIVLDASGSMLAKIDGQPKMDIARKALSTLLADWDPDVEVGLVAYGHRRKGDCDDIEVVVPCGKVDKDAINQAAAKLTPLGKTPLSAATILAADTLKYSEETATVILISDGEETCDKDPCAVAKELESKGVGFTAHVIGFDVSDPAHIAQLKCLAENTGGKYLPAQNAGELQSALSTVAKEVSTAPTPSATPAPAVKSSELYVSAYYTEGGEPVKDNVDWRIYKDEGQFGKDDLGTILIPYYEARSKVEVPKGKYIVSAKLGLATANTQWNTEKGPRELKVAMNAGVVNLWAKPSATGDPIDSNLTWTIFNKKNDKETLDTNYDAKPKFTLPVGDYVIKVGWGAAKAEQEITVKAGESQDVALDLKAGVLVPSAVYAAEGDEVKEGLYWTVSAAKADIAGNREKFADSYDAKPSFMLSEGQYLLTAKVGEASVEGTIEVKANDRGTTDVVLNAGILNVKTKHPSPTITVNSAKKDISGNQKNISTGYENDYTLTLPAGDYIVESIVGQSKTEKPCTIKAGERSELEFE